MQTLRDEPIAQYLNSEPVAMLGISYTELTTIAIGSFLAWIPIVILVGMAIGWLLIPAIFILGVIVTTVRVAAVLRTAKRNRPDRYYMHRVRYRLGRAMPLLESTIILRSGTWALGRTAARGGRPR